MDQISLAATAISFVVEALKTALPPRYQKHAHTILAILERHGDDYKAIVKELKAHNIIAKATYEKYVTFWEPAARLLEILRKHQFQENVLAILKNATQRPSVYLLTSGDESEGDPWKVHSIHSSRDSAEKAKEARYFRTAANIEEWPVDG